MTLYYETAPYTLLLADDSQGVREYIKAILIEKLPHFKVYEASCGAEAIDIFNKEKIDCVLLDYNMDDMNAFELVSTLQHGPTLSKPIIVLTACERDDLDLELIECGATDFISKDDVSPEILKRVILRSIVRFQYYSSQSYFKLSEQQGEKKKAVELAIQKEHEKLKEANRKLKFMAMHDSLTGLANRAMLQEHLNRTISYSKRHDKEFYVLFLDLDRFKNVNDSLGHEYGDILLLNVARRIGGILRSEDILARIGGDEFSIVLNGCDSISDVITVCQRINQIVAKKIVIEDADIFISTSIGVSVYPSNGDTPQKLLKCADSAMYAAKDKGKNTYAFYDKDIPGVSEIFKMEADLHQAIDNNELSIEYQPKVSLIDNKVYGAEALVRWWNHSHGGCISPGVFIPLAEESDLILRLGSWVREQVCMQIDKWKNTEFADLKIAVNSSSKEFMKGSILSHLKYLIGKYDIDASLIDLEITERTVVEELSSERSCFHDIRKMGCGLSIDDFGTGYSSLSYLKDMPISELKIDQSFINNNSTHNQAISKTIIELARNLNMCSIAEGVETEEQLNFLKNVGCDSVQGYYYAKPLTIDMFELWVMKNRETEK